MKNTFFMMIIFVIICSACKEKYVDDVSLSLKELKALGMPDPNKVWGFRDYAEAGGILITIKIDKPFALPRKDSKRSGAVFDRIVNIENLSFLEDDSLPLNEKAHRLKGFLNVYNDWVQVYKNIMIKGEYYHRELVALDIFNISVSQKMLDLAYEINASDDPEDKLLSIDYRSIEYIYLNSVLVALDNQKHTSKYLKKDLDVLSDSLSNSVLNNRPWMEKDHTDALKEALNVVIDSTSSEHIRKTYTALTEEL